MTFVMCRLGFDRLLGKCTNLSLFFQFFPNLVCLNLNPPGCIGYTGHFVDLHEANHEQRQVGCGKSLGCGGASPRMYRDFRCIERLLEIKVANNETCARWCTFAERALFLG